jgi:hypothetical protein
MTEAEWLVGSDPVPMLQFLKDRGSDRKRRLFAVACCRRFWHLIRPEECRQAVTAAERFADGEIGEKELGDRQASAQAAAARVLRACAHATVFTADPAGDSALWALPVVRAACWAAVPEAAKLAGRAAYLPLMAAESRHQAGLVRDVFGNPFRPAVVAGDWLTWDSGTIPRLAQSLHDDRAFTDLPVLADALEEAGCTDPDILGHCRQGGQHVRGCWVVDLVLGRE